MGRNDVMEHKGHLAAYLATFQSTILYDVGFSSSGNIVTISVQIGTAMLCFVYLGYWNSILLGESINYSNVSVLSFQFLTFKWCQ